MYWFFIVIDGRWYDAGYTRDADRAAAVAELPDMAVIGW